VSLENNLKRRRNKKLNISDLKLIKRIQK